MKKRCGIYLIENTVSGKKYVGSSANIEQRIGNHLRGHGSLTVRRAIIKYGVEALVVKVLEECDKAELLVQEAKWITKLKPEYNLAALTETGARVVSPETRAKMSAASKGRPSPNKGIPQSAEARLKMSLAKRGKPGSRKGIPHSEAAKAKMSAARAGRPLSEEQKVKMVHKSGWKQTPEARAKIAAARTGVGIPHRPEVREAIRQTMLSHWRDAGYRRARMAARSRVQGG